MQDGKTLTKRRKELGWTQEGFADIYGWVLQGYPVSREAIKNMEKYGLPKDPMRRAILATLLGIPLASLGMNVTTRSLETLILPTVKTGPIDLVEYRSALDGYQGKRLGAGYEWIETVTDALSRIQTLHNKVLYASSAKLEMVKLLCGFHLLVAEICTEQCLNGTVESFNKPVILAREYRLGYEYAFALLRRGNYFLDHGDSELAGRDFHQALKVKNLPPHLKGPLLTGTSVSIARLADNEDTVKDALSQLEEAANLTSNQKQGHRKFDLDRWLLDRAAVLVGSPLKDCRYPDQALAQLEQVMFPDDSRRSQYRQTFSNILQAKAYIDKKEYPFAAGLASDAVGIMTEMKAYDHTPDIEKLYTALKETKDGQSKPILKLGVDLLKVQHPELFPVD